MKFLCLAAIHTHEQCWLENLVQCFLDQTHREATLLILDDRPKEFRYPSACDFVPWSIPNVAYAITTNRKNMAQKYNDGLKLAVDIPYGAVCVWDDDDFYPPTALEQHAEVLKDHVWSTPESILSIYGPSVIPVRVDGLYWASYAFRREITDKHGFVDYPGLGYDQEMVKMVRREYGPPGLTKGIPYIYNWSGVQQHLSVSGTSYTDTSWPERVKPVAATGPLEPKRHPLFDWALREARNYL
jgi:glycosyltransferase involved in cell wall biosynthesis